MALDAMGPNTVPQLKVREMTVRSELPKVEPTLVRYAMAKRLLDVVASVVILLLAFPIMLFIAIAIRLTSKGPILYRSARVGLGGVPFYFLKFRSMYVDADERRKELLRHNEKDGPIFKIAQDPRITPIGRFLRKYSLDELPQFIHVLMGQMTLVGPRPPIPSEVLHYDDDCLVRLSVKPGITCYWQVMGRSHLSFSEWMELDRRYVEEMSFWLDLKILAKTPAAVFRGHGAF